MRDLRRLIVVANTDWFVVNFMLPFLAAHVDRGIDVCAMTPAGPYRQDLERAGIRWRELDLPRGGANLLAALATIPSLRRAYREERADVIHLTTALPVLLGTSAAAGGPGVINAIPGLGHFFTGFSMRDRVTRSLLRLGLRWAARQPRSVIVFQQEADRFEILSAGHAARISSFLVPGWGIDLTRFSRRSAPSYPPIVLLPARMLWTKGVEEFVEAARRCRQVVPARFVLAGAPDPGNPRSIHPSQLRAWEAEGAIEWWGHRANMPEVLSEASIVVLPTRYGEGVPQSLIEASAMEIPIVATDIPGCRQVVDEGVNGILVPVADPHRLAQTLLRLLQDPEERRKLSSRSRAIVTAKFDVARIFASYEEIYRRLGFEVPRETDRG